MNVLRHPNVCAHRCVFLLLPFMDLFETAAFVVWAASKHVKAFPLRTIEPFEYCFFYYFLFIGTLNLHLHCSYPPLAATSIVNTLESVLLQHRESSSAASPQKFKHNSFISLADMYLCFGTSLEPLKNALINMQSGLLELFLQPCCHVNPSLLRWTVSWKASLVFPEESKEI